MEQIWAPWRIRYILGEKSKECVFCSKSGGRNEQGEVSEDEKNLVLLRGKACFALLNTFPYNPGHVMVAPYLHTDRLDELGAHIRAELMEMTSMCRDLLQKAFHPEGTNIGMNLGQAAGAGILNHLHMHIVPRWSGDTNFMPVLSDTRVLPEGLAEVYAKLRKTLEG